jgi:putative ABC transport system substrate-binding protein
MKRRTFIGMAALLGSPAAFSQQAARTFKLGILFAGTLASSENYFRAFFESLASLGYVEGKNLLVERRFADGRIDRLEVLAVELVAANVDVIFAPPTPAVLASRKATTVIPIVFSLPPDPVGTGLVKSLSRPGGNVTGVSTFGSGLVPKRIELIRELVPKAQRIGVLYDSREPSARSNRDSALRTARALGLTIIGAEAHSREGIPLAFALLKKERADALLVFEGSLALTNRELVLSLAAANALPALYTYPEIPTEGGLMSYTANTLEQYRRAASYVDKILKGAKPGDLPIEQPTTFELVINLKTAKALGIRIPPSILLRADRVLE